MVNLSLIEKNFFLYFSDNASKFHSFFFNVHVKVCQKKQFFVCIFFSCCQPNAFICPYLLYMNYWLHLNEQYVEQNELADVDNVEKHY